MTIRRKRRSFLLNRARQEPSQSINTDHLIPRSGREEGPLGIESNIIKEAIEPLSEWESVVLFEDLRRGPKGYESPEQHREQEDEKKGYDRWVKATENLTQLVDTNLGLFWDKIIDPSGIDDDESITQNDEFLQLVETVNQCLDAFFANRSYESLETLAQAIHAALRAQSQEVRSDMQVFQDYLNAGKVRKHNNNISWIEDRYGGKFLVPMLAESLQSHTTAEIVPRKSGRIIQRDQCVRLVTNKHASLGMYSGMVGYVLDLSFQATS